MDEIKLKMSYETKLKCSKCKKLMVNPSEDEIKFHEESKCVWKA